MHPCPEDKQTHDHIQRLGMMTGASSGGGFTREANHFLPLTPLRELAPSHPKREGSAMLQATVYWLRVEEVIA